MTKQPVKIVYHYQIVVTKDFIPLVNLVEGCLFNVEVEIKENPIENSLQKDYLASVITYGSPDVILDADNINECIKIATDWIDSDEPWWRCKSEARDVVGTMEGF